MSDHRWYYESYKRRYGHELVKKESLTREELTEMKESILNNCKEWITELNEYRDKRDTGLLVELPCKVGDVLYMVGNTSVCDYTVKEFIVTECGVESIKVEHTSDGRGLRFYNSFSPDAIGSYVFFDKEEAERQLHKL